MDRLPDAAAARQEEASTITGKPVAGGGPDVAVDDGKPERVSALKGSAVPGRPTRITLADRSKVDAHWALVDADHVGATMGPAENQARDRGRAASKAQIAAIAQAPDYDLVSDSPTLNDGAPAMMPDGRLVAGNGRFAGLARSEEHTSELQSLMRISYAVFCLKKKQ